MPRYVPTFNTSTIRPTPLLAKIDAVGQAGYGAIELWNDDVTDFLSQGGSLEQVKERMATHNLRMPTVVAVYRWVGAGNTDREALRAEAVRRMEQARNLGAQRIIASPPDGPADLAACGRDYAELMRIGRDLGILPAMEFLGFREHINNLPVCMEILERAGEPEGTVVIDFFHMVSGDGTTPEDLAKVPGRMIAVVHLNDVPYDKPFAEMLDPDRVYPGDGDIPLDEWFDALVQTGYEGCVSLELFNEELWKQDPREVARVGFEKSRRWFDYSG